MSELVKKNERLSKQDGEEMLVYGKMLLSNGEKDKGIKFIRFAAQHGCLNAAVTLGDCYETGNGVTRDIKIAGAYYRQAAVSGIEEARRKLNALSGQLYKKIQIRDLHRLIQIQQISNKNKVLCSVR